MLNSSNADRFKIKITGEALDKTFKVFNNFFVLRGTSDFGLYGLI
jgi:hypothetical protein